MQRTDYATDFGMKVEHGSVQVVVAQDYLEVANEGASLERMSGKPVAQTVRRQSF